MNIAPVTKRFGRYLTVGLVTNTVLYLAFLLLIWLQVAPIIASGLCYVMGVAGGYLLNRSWTFSSTGAHRTDIAKYLAAYGFGLLVTLGSMALFVGILGPAVAQIITIGIAAVTIYSTLEILKFGQ